MRPERIVVLGPQRIAPTLLATADSLGLGAGPFATVTAGWEEREKIDLELAEHLEGQARNLRLYDRCEEVFRTDPELFAGLRQHHQRLRRSRELYRSRLQHAAEAARELLYRLPRSENVDDRGTELEDLDEECGAAIEALRKLDADHLQRVRTMRGEFESEWMPMERESVARQHEEIARALDDVPCICIAGGHVAVLLERLRLFDIHRLLDGRTVIAWSAGAMALSQRIILFHDHPPQGPGNAEAFDNGLGLLPDFVPLPHANKRLRLEDPVRVGLFARRFGPSLCMTLDQESRADWDGKNWTVAAGSKRLTPEGMVEELQQP